MENNLLQLFLQGIRVYTSSYMKMIYRKESESTHVSAIRLFQIAEEISMKSGYRIIGYMYSDILLELGDFLSNKKAYTVASQRLSMLNEYSIDYYDANFVHKELFELQNNIFSFDNLREVRIEDVRSFVERSCSSIHYLFLFADKKQVTSDFNKAVDDVIQLAIESLMKLLDSNKYKKEELSREKIQEIYIKAIASLYALCQLNIEGPVRESLIKYRQLLEGDYMAIAGKSVSLEELAEVIDLSGKRDVQCFANCSAIKDFTTYLLEYPNGIFNNIVVYTDASINLLPECEYWLDCLNDRQFGLYSKKYPKGLFAELDHFFVQRMC